MVKTVVITGANRGIGLSLVQHYQSRSCRVFALCRQASGELKHSGAEFIEGIDVSNDNVMSVLQQRLSGVSFDLLINNAGVLANEVLGAIDFDSIRYQIEVNALGPLRVVEALVDQLSPNAKVAMITSRMGSIADNTSGGRYGYRMSKAALNIASVSLAKDLEKAGHCAWHHSSRTGRD